MFAEEHDTAVGSLQAYATLLRPNLTVEEVGCPLDSLLFGDPRGTCLACFSQKDPDMFWWNSHTFDECREHSRLSLLFVKMTTTERNVERLLGAEKGVTGLYIGSEKQETRLSEQ